jgi:heme A synthase
MFGRITLALFFLLLVWGNLVAGLKAGLACPDWPLCQGKILPPFRFDVWMEFTHRLIAFVATVFLLRLARQRLDAYDGLAKMIPVAAFGLIATEVALGGITVLLELPAQVTTVHFMVGLAVFLLAGYMAAFDGAGAKPRFTARGYAGLFLGLGMLLYFQAALGAYVRHTGAGLACPDFPTCLGRWLPHLGGIVLVQYSHRLLALLIVCSIAALAAAAFRDERLRQHRSGVVALLILGIAQIGAGAGVVESGLNFAAAAIHLALALSMLIVIGRMWFAETETIEGESS